MTPKELVQRVGSASKIARAINRLHSTVLLWKAIPPHHVLTIEEKFGIPREELRPDLYRKTTTPTQRSAS